MIKKPRDFVHVDEFYRADSHWPSYFIDDTVWIFYDEYNPGLIGDEDYCRIIVHAGQTTGLICKRPLSEKPALDRLLKKIECPVSERQLLDLGFEWWHGSYD
ncbi:MAG: hypothetical protein KDI04_04505 [Halieaceae bacterium]|nr:hypothetical protein [Halieaceae bacterium]